MAGIRGVTLPAQLGDMALAAMQLATATGVTACQNGTLGKNKVPHAGKELIMGARIAVEVVFYAASGSGRITMMVGLKPLQATQPGTPWLRRIL